MNPSIFVTGVTGTVGQEVVKSLLEKNVKIKVGVRNINKIKNASWKNQVEIVPLDYDAPETIKKSLENVDKLFLVTPPGTFQEKEVAEKILTLGISQGLKHIIRLSGLGAEKHNIFANHQAADSLLLNSSIDFTAVRPNTFMQNFYNYLTSIKEQHKIFEPAGNGKTSFIDARDIAAVAATVLTESGHENKIYDLTGDEAFDYYQVAKIFSDILGFEVTYQPLSISEYIKEKEAFGMQPSFSKRFVEFFSLMQNGEYALISPNVENILRRPPITLEKFIKDYKHKFNN